MAIFLLFLAKKIPNFEFSHGYHYSHTLVNTQEKTLGSFQPKLMIKIEVFSQKTGSLAKKGHFLTLFCQKIPNFEFFHGYHYSHTLVDTQNKILGSFQPNVMTKFKVTVTLPAHGSKSNQGRFFPCAGSVMVETLTLFLDIFGG